MSDNVKLFLTCMLLSFIVGAYTVALYEADRYECTVVVRDGSNNKHEFTGRINR